LVKDLLFKNNVTSLEPSPYSPDLALVDCYLFPRLKSALKRRGFCEAFHIFNNVTEGLKKLTQNGFQECFLHRYSRWQKCIFAQGDCFEGSVA
jgi:hypothetical protein